MEAKLKHLEFIQSLITRFNSNCFLVKGWAVTLVAALFALAAKDANERYLLITYVATVIFWLLDAYYLAYERQYRQLYHEVSQKDPSTIDFSLDISPYRHGRNTWWRAIQAQTLFIFYGSLAALPLLLLIIFKRLF
jgi:hypothetical protein